MNATLLILALAVAAPLPAKVERANGWPEVPAAGFHKPSPGPPLMDRVSVGTRKWQVIREWRDPAQHYAIFWTAATRGYRAFEIVDGRYRALPTDDAPHNQATLWPSYEDAANQVDNHWRGAAGLEQVSYQPSPALKRIQDARRSARR